MKKKVSLKEKIRRQNQSCDNTEYLDGAGGTFRMKKAGKDCWSMQIDPDHDLTALSNMIEKIKKDRGE